MLFFFNIFFLFIIVSIIDFSKNEKMIFAETLSRHGARAPLKLNPEGLDVFGSKWTIPGELTPIGKRMEYTLGLINRNRYITKYKLLPEKYDPHELIVYSSDINRTLESMTSQLQGFYPMSSDIGDKITVDQYNASFPPIDVDMKDIEEEIKSLNDSALPNYMTVIPIHFITLKNTTPECAERVQYFNEKNTKEISILKNFIEEFHKNYSEKLNDFYGKPKGSKFDFSFINAIFDGLIADLTEGRNVSSYFIKNGIEENDFLSRRYDVLSMNFRDYIFGDDNNEVILFYDSPIMREMINYMERRIEDDINGEQSLKNYSDYSRPKMVLILGHDTTLSAHEMFFIRFFNLSLESYKYPTYTSQISYEITREDDDKYPSGKKLSDYKVSYYFNNKLVFNMTFDKFKEKIEKVIWNSEQMNNFCSIKKNVENNTDNESLDISLILIIAMGFIILLLVIIIIILIVKLSKRKDDLYNSSLLNNQKIWKDDE